ncbi:MAG: TIGR00730 family Rossman fold protein [Parvibaculum sp.]|uniref:LOG family protein n=1 Tax=Parvibaculum sp. TaxID=2024848 RepID=UPI00284CCD03|nr:TIGR00730 family Rossman fold protein [Parvibaculum sp.]MDR3499585.1 TIGR00730 family Rossman fold protein [Parvibaculum sp.]
MKISNICVYCGSQDGGDPDLTAAATRLGGLLAKADVGLVYGGASIGVMGALARAVLDNGGHVTGVIPEFLFREEVPLRSVSELIVTDSMHSRKRTMFERSDAFVALPGGIGTLEELIEMLTWAQLGRHKHPIVIANLKGFWNPLIDLLDHMIETKFVGNSIRRFYGVVDRVEDILPRIEAAL